MNNLNYKNIFQNAPFGFAIHKIILDESGIPIDYICLEINKAYEELTGVLAKDIVNRKITEVFPNINNEKLNWIETAGKVALSGEPFEKVEYVIQFDKWFRVKLYSPDKYYFVTAFTDVTELKNEEQKNKKLEDIKYKKELQLNNIVNTGAAYIAKTNLEGEYTFCNKKYYDEFGWIFNNSDLIGKNSMFALHPTEKESTLEIIKKCINNPGIYYQLELLQPELNGECKTFLWEFVCTKDINNQPNEMLFVGLDITERIKSESKLKENEDKFRLIFENISDGILIFSGEKDILYASQSYLEMMGYEPDEIVGKNINDFYEFIHPDDREVLFRNIFEAIKNIVSNIRYTYRIKHKNNYYIWREDNANFIYDSNGKLKNSYVICRDITQRKVFEEQLKQERDLFTSGPVVNIIWKVSENWQIKYVSINCLSEIGYSQYEMMDNDFGFTSIIHPDDLPRVKEEVKYFKQNLVESFSQSYRIRNKAGNYKWFYDFTKMERDDLGNIKHARGYIFDQSNLIETKEKLIINEQKLANVIKGTKTGTWEWNIQTGVVNLNERWGEIIGYNLDELYPMNIDKFLAGIHPEDLPKLNQLLTLHFDGELKYYDAEFRMKHKNGSWVWINSRGCIIEWTFDNKPLLMTGNHIDISARKSAEEKVIANEKRLELIYDSIIDLYYKTDLEGVILEISPSVYLLSGYTQEEIIGKHVNKIYNEYNDRQILIDTLMKYGKISNFETQLKTKSGKLVDVSINTQILFDSKGNPDSIAGTIRDVTAQKETSEKLKYALARNQALLDSNPDLMFVINSEQIIIDFKASKYNELYMQPEHFLGMTIAESLPPNVAELCKSKVNKVLDTGETQHATYFLNINDEILHYEARFVKCSTKEVMAIIRNITEQVKSEELTQKLSKAVEQSPVSIFITDTEGKIEFINPKFTDTTGYTLDEVFGKLPSIIKSGYHSDELYSHIWNKIKSGKEWIGELYNRTKSGKLIWESVKISPIFNNDNKITHFVAITEDITERKKIIEDLISAKEKAEENDRLKTAFLQNMSHEIRTPLNGIIGFSKLISSSELSRDDINEYADIIKICGNRLIETINNILDISMIETGQMTINPTNFSINSVIEELYTYHRNSAILQSNKLIYFTDLTNEESYIFNDSIKINQILTNLISNAIKFTSGGIVKFGYQFLDNDIVFSVSDTGVGISEENQSRIFDRFWQGDTSISRSYEGSGLGLAISIELTELLGGKLWLESVEGSGSTFYFKLKAKKII